PPAPARAAQKRERVNQFLMSHALLITSVVLGTRSTFDGNNYIFDSLAVGTQGFAGCLDRILDSLNSLSRISLRTVDIYIEPLQHVNCGLSSCLLGRSCRHQRVMATNL